MRHFEGFQNVVFRNCIKVLGYKLALNGLLIKLFNAFLFSKNEHWIIKSSFKNIKIKEKKIMKLSARNQFKGKVVEINEGAVNGTVKIDIGGGNIISSVITMASIKELGLAVGKEAYAVIKASSVMVAVD